MAEQNKVINLYILFVYIWMKSYVEGMVGELMTEYAGLKCRIFICIFREGWYAN